MSVQVNLAAGYLSGFENPIGVSVMAKLNQWPFLQRLGFSGTLTNLNQAFHGLGDFNNEMAEYSSTDDLLELAWTVIRQIVPQNPIVSALMFNSSVLGQVGKEFQQMTGFGQAFALSPDQLKSPAAIQSAVDSYIPQATTTSSTIAVPTNPSSVPDVGSGGGSGTGGVSVTED